MQCRAIYSIRQTRHTHSVKERKQKKKKIKNNNHTATYKYVVPGMMDMLRM